MAKQVNNEWLVKKLRKTVDKIENAYNNDELNELELLQMRDTIEKFSQVISKGITKAGIGIETVNEAEESPFRDDDDETFIKGTKLKAKIEDVELTKEYVDEMRPAYEESKEMIDIIKDILK